jgi:two-component system, NtrC family, nitrogen regulation sensor histidine kinase NtrY
MRRFSILVIIRITFLVITALLLSWIFGDSRLFFNQVILVLIMIAQIWELIHYVNHTNRELSRLFLAIKHDDFSITFNQSSSLGRSFKELQDSMTDIIRSYKDVKIEKEAQYQFLQWLVSQIQVGIITIQGDNVVLINPVAEKMLGIKNIKNWNLLAQMNPRLVEDLADSGKKLIEIKSPDGVKMLAVEVSTLIMMDKPYKIITIQDINSEIEQKEIEAWHKLIRILTHEIMNSVTPISSLSETMQTMLSNSSGNQKSLEEIQAETIKDIRFSLNTIQKRSERLLDFVENYRTLTRIPKPVMGTVQCHTLCASVKNLMLDQLTRKEIDMMLDIPESLTISADESLVEQVLINLVTNSIHALENRSHKRIDIRGLQEDQSVILEVHDTGKGIPDKEQREIFVPFFSTKKEGSGIGLSLSKQIMSLHGGRIRVASKVDEGTSFFLTFKKTV